MKNNFIKVLTIICLLSLVACKKDKNKTIENKTNESESVSKPAVDSKTEMLELNQELEDFDENYSEFLKGFYQTINDINAFSKGGGEDKKLKRKILNALSKSPKSVGEINIPENLKPRFQPPVDSLERILSEFVDLKGELKEYVKSEAWRENNRNEIYQLGGKAEKLSRQYEHTFSELNANLN